MLINLSIGLILNNLKIQNNIIENSWKNGVKRLLFLEVVVFIKFKQPIKEEILTSSLEITNDIMLSQK